MHKEDKDFEYAKLFLQQHCASSVELKVWSEWLSFKGTSKSQQWLYLYHFAPSIFAWGTTTNSSNRLRCASLFHTKLTGKYDRRVDYLMLKIIFGMLAVWVFKCNQGEKATDIEGVLRNYFDEQAHCYRGFHGQNRKEISEEIYKKFQYTPHYLSLPIETRTDFERFMTEVFFAFRKHPKNSRRTFYWGDSLEPGFLPKIGLGTLESAVEATLRVKF